MEELDDHSRKVFKNVVSQFKEVELDKYHVRVNREFIKKSIRKLRTKTSQESPSRSTALIRISDRSYISFDLVSNVLTLIKHMLIYLKIHDCSPALYFMNEKYDGFLCLVKQKPDSIIFDIIEK